MAPPVNKITITIVVPLGRAAVLDALASMDTDAWFYMVGVMMAGLVGGHPPVVLGDGPGGPLYGVLVQHQRLRAERALIGLEAPEHED